MHSFKPAKPCKEPHKTYEKGTTEEVRPQEDHTAKENKSGTRKTIAFEDIDPDAEICTIDEACRKIGISRSTLAAKREAGYITDILLNKDEKEVRFFLSEVLLLKKWYATHKGKTGED